MKEIPLPHGKVALVDDKDFESASRFKWHLASMGYAQTSMHIGMLGGKGQNSNMLLHRLIIHPPKGMEVDHINHNPLDCRRANMRICTHQENSYNIVKRKGRSKYKGVWWHKAMTKWSAAIRHNGKRIYLGYFYDEAAAAIAYDAKAKELFGEFAHLNF